MHSFRRFLFGFIALTSIATLACSGTSTANDAGEDRVLPTDSAQTDSALDAAPDTANRDVVTMDIVGTDIVGTDTVNTDTPRVDTPGDAPASDTALGPCALPNGGTCARGATCPAGDGCNDCTCPSGPGNAMCTARPCAADSGRTDVASDTGAGRCSTSADCRLFSSYCSTAPCVCIPLSSTERDPVCGGGMVTCFVDPCARARAACVGGVCVTSM